MSQTKKTEGFFLDWASTQKNRDLSLFFESIIMNAKLWMMFLDTDRNVVIWNKAAGEISGYSSAEVLGNTAIWRWIYPDASYRREVTEQIVERMRSKKNLENFETSIRTKNGETKRISWNTQELIGEDGIGIGYIIVGNDITEKVLAKKVMRESEELFYGITTVASDAIVLLGQDGIIRYWNPEAEKLFGMSSDTFMRNNFFSLFSPDQYRDKYLSDFRTFFIANTGPFSQCPCELKMQNSSGEALHLEMSLAFFHFKGKWNALGIFRDITSRVNAEQREREILLNAILQGSPIPQFMIDKNHVVVFWNRALEKYSGIKACDVTGTDQHWRAFYDEKRPCLADLLLDNAINEIDRLYENKSSKSRLVEDAYEAKDFFPKMGKEGTWLYFTAAVIKASEGNVIGVLETLEDITDAMLGKPR